MFISAMLLVLNISNPIYRTPVLARRSEKEILVVVYFYRQPINKSHHQCHQKNIAKTCPKVISLEY